MSYKWSFSPVAPEVREEPRTPLPLKKGKEELWWAPEHERIAKDMRQDYPRDDWGNRIRGEKRRLVVDTRPSILVPPRPTKPAPPFYKAVHAY